MEKRMKCAYCRRKATRNHARHDNSNLESLCEIHYARWHPENADRKTIISFFRKPVDVREVDRIFGDSITEIMKIYGKYLKHQDGAIFLNDDGKRIQSIRKKEVSEKDDKDFIRFVPSLVLESQVYEQVWDGEKTKFVFLNNGQPTFIEEIEHDGFTYLPINDDAIKLGAVLLPTEPVDFGSIEDLVHEIREHIHSYLDVSPEYEIFATYYVLLTWVYDKINTLPYLRALGDTGTGKSRFLDVVGRLCYKPIIMSGAVTPAPIYRMIKKWKGTLVLDEADFRDSSEKQEVIKILNCGFERGRPVIRCFKDRPDELDICSTFGPKIFATRFTFHDKALESRCLTEVLRTTRRKDIPVILPQQFFEKEKELRNKLLMFRLKYYDKIKPEDAENVDLGNIEPRLRQATSSFTVLFANIPEMMDKFRAFLAQYNRELIEERASSFTGMVANALIELINEGKETISAKDIVEYLIKNEGYDKITPQAIGKHIKSLGLKTKNTRVDGRVVKAIIPDESIFEEIRSKYIPPESEDVASVANVAIPYIERPHSLQHVLQAQKNGKCSESEGLYHSNATNATNATNGTKYYSDICHDPKIGDKAFVEPDYPKLTPENAMKFWIGDPNNGDVMREDRWIERLMICFNVDDEKAQRMNELLKRRGYIYEIRPGLLKKVV
jgi:hypothetical protein